MYTQCRIPFRPFLVLPSQVLRAFVAAMLLRMHVSKRYGHMLQGPIRASLTFSNVIAPKLMSEFIFRRIPD